MPCPRPQEAISGNWGGRTILPQRVVLRGKPSLGRSDRLFQVVARGPFRISEGTLYPGTHGPLLLQFSSRPPRQVASDQLQADENGQKCPEASQER